MPHNLIFMALHFVISKCRVFCFSVWATSFTNRVYCSVRELSFCNVSGPYFNSVVPIVNID